MADKQIKMLKPERMADGEILYKYRSLQNWNFLLDIFLNKRLYAAMYKDLNDPMEGFYEYKDDLVSREFRKTLKAEIVKLERKQLDKPKKSLPTKNMQASLFS